MADLWDLVDFTATSNLGLPPAGQEAELSQLPPPLAPLIISNTNLLSTGREAQLQVPTSEITWRPPVEQRGTGTQRIQDGTSQTLQGMILCADSEINLEVGWPPARDQAVAGSHIAISNVEEKILKKITRRYY